MSELSGWPIAAMRSAIASRAPSIELSVWELPARMTTESLSPASRIVIETSSRPPGERSTSISLTGWPAAAGLAAGALARGVTSAPAAVAVEPSSLNDGAAAKGAEISAPNGSACANDGAAEPVGSGRRPPAPSPRESADAGGRRRTRDPGRPPAPPLPAHARRGAASCAAVSRGARPICVGRARARGDWRCGRRILAGRSGARRRGRRARACAVAKPAATVLSPPPIHLGREVLARGDGQRERRLAGQPAACNRARGAGGGEVKGAFAERAVRPRSICRLRRQTRRRPRLLTLWPQPGRARTRGPRLANPRPLRRRR